MSAEDRKLTLYLEHPGNCDEQRRVLQRVLPADRTESRDDGSTAKSSDRSAGASSCTVARAPTTTMFELTC